MTRAGARKNTGKRRRGKGRNEPGIRLDSHAPPSRREAATRSDYVSHRGFDWRVLLVLLVIVAGVLAFYNSFDGVVLFDDDKHIVNNPRIREVFPLSHTMSGRRPLVNLSLAINYKYGYEQLGYQESKLDVWGFHAFNLTVHLLAAMTLFGVVRRTLMGKRLRESVGAAAPWLALAISLIWVVHPLQTQSVTYLIQRGESMMGLFYLLTLYCVIRGMAASRAVAWYVVAVVFCAMGMGSKAVMITAPLMVLLYDRTFISNSLIESFRRRWGLYVGLAATWGVLVACGVVRGVVAPIGDATTVGFGYKGISPLQYALTQPGVIAYYLKLSFWPHPLCLDYNWPVAGSAMDVLRPAVVLVPLLAVTIWGLLEKSWIGFVGAWFFLILSPTSSFIPIKDTLFEHRMYLPLAAVIVMVVALAYAGLGILRTRAAGAGWVSRLLAGVLLTATVVPLTYATIRRNRDYRSEFGMWRDVARKRPDNHRGHLGLGTALFSRGETEEAEHEFREAVRLKRGYADAHYNLANALAENQKLKEAVGSYLRALRMKTNYAKAHYNLANVYKKLRRWDDALEEYRNAIADEPGHIRARINLGNTLKLQRKFAEAVLEYQKALQLNPGHANAHHNLGDAYNALGRIEEALAEFERALEIDNKHQAARRAIKSMREKLGLAE